MTVGIIDYGAGNVFSVQKSLERLGVNALISSDIQELSSAERLIFPGVGHASLALGKLEQYNLIPFIKNYRRPFLGICLGMQLMGCFLEEAAKAGLCLVNADVVKFKTNKIIPHTGWNHVYDLIGVLFKDIPIHTDFYFVHSYYMVTNPFAIALCKYEDELFTAAIQKDNFYGVQFHPEKSGRWGAKVLENFLKIKHYDHYTGY
jgi:glutamine amidotransferase